MAGRERLTSALNGLKYACVALLYLGQMSPDANLSKVLWPQLKIGLLLPNALINALLYFSVFILFTCLLLTGSIQQLISINICLDV